ncbi:MAG TPA: AbrB/MazE/SpoVT family DNA-binding domain-containing protein [Microbacteriaceae bacterium]|nr:AbrB/MazE/SpoVT family DNA-binding domain-containing protein [Microbacteriaceae bacterium]
MNGTVSLRMGERGRLVIPRELRTHHRWVPGTPIVAIDSEVGVTLVEQSALRKIVAAQLSGRDLVQELIAERKEDARIESGL